MNTNEWVSDRPNILSENILQQVKAALERGYIVMEHHHFCGGRSLDKTFIEDFDGFMEYLKSKAKPVDLFFLYAIDEPFAKNLFTLSAKFPDAQCRVPVGGAY